MDVRKDMDMLCLWWEGGNVEFGFMYGNHELAIGVAYGDWIGGRTFVDALWLAKL